MAKRKSLKLLKVPFGLAGASIGANLVGSALGNQLPSGTPNPLTSIGTGAARAAGITGTIALTGIAIQELKNLKPKRKKRRK